MSIHPQFRVAFPLLIFILLTVAVLPAYAHKDHKTVSNAVAATPTVTPPVTQVKSEQQAPVPPSKDQAQTEDPTTFLSWLGRFHPVVVHFPIALLITAALGEALFARTQETFFSNAVRFCISVGAAGAFAAAPLGWMFAGFRLVDDEWVLTAHRWAGTTTFVATLALFWVSERTFRAPNASRTALRVALGGVACLVSLTGFLGGSLLYGIDHYAW